MAGGAGCGVGHAAPDGGGAARRAHLDPAGRAGLGRRIAEVRLRLNLSRAAFAHRIGVSRNMIARYEDGAVPRTEILDRLAQAGGTSLDWLLHGRDAEPLPRDQAWRNAVQLLRAAWEDPRRRAAIVSVLRGSDPSAHPGSPRAPSRRPSGTLAEQ